MLHASFWRRLVPLLIILVGLVSLEVLSHPSVVHAEGISATTHSSTSVPQLKSSYPLPDWWRPCLQFDKTSYKLCTKWDTSKNPVKCDGVNYQHNTGVKAVLLTTWRGIQVCGPLPFSVSTPDNYVHFKLGWSVEQEFECTELVKRYLYLAYGLKSLGGTNGDQIVDNYTAAYSILHKVVNNGQIHLFPAEGDVLSFSGNHTAIVTGLTNVDRSNGNATINVIEQNFSSKRTTLVFQCSESVQIQAPHLVNRLPFSIMYNDAPITHPELPGCVIGACF
ncbi:MAG: hypothetical protein ACJ8DI_24805 [Ktedonobacteraceae bacterium]